MPAELVKLICLRGDGHTIPKSIYTKYASAVKMIDEIKALLFKKSKYEDYCDVNSMMEDIYQDLSLVEINTRK